MPWDPLLAAEVSFAPVLLSPFALGLLLLGAGLHLVVRWARPSSGEGGPQLSLVVVAVASCGLAGLFLVAALFNSIAESGGGEPNVPVATRMLVLAGVSAALAVASVAEAILSRRRVRSLGSKRATLWLAAVALLVAPIPLWLNAFPGPFWNTFAPGVSLGGRLSLRGFAVATAIAAALLVVRSLQLRPAPRLPGGVQTARRPGS